MAVLEDVAIDHEEGWVVVRQTCPEKLTGWYRECVDDWCIERQHMWFTVTWIQPDGYGQDSGEVFDWEFDAVDWAREQVAARQGA